MSLGKHLEGCTVDEKGNTIDDLLELQRNNCKHKLTYVRKIMALVTRILSIHKIPRWTYRVKNPFDAKKCVWHVGGNEIELLVKIDSKHYSVLINCSVPLGIPIYDEEAVIVLKELETILPGELSQYISEGKLECEMHPI